MTGRAGKEIHGTLIEDRGTWVVRAKVWDPVSGKTKFKSKSTGLKVQDHTKRQATKMIHQIVAEWAKERDRLIEEFNNPHRRDTFGTYVQDWLESKRLTVRQNSLKSYQDYANKHIIPQLGNYRVQDIDWRVLQGFYDRILIDHKPNSAKKINVVVRGALDDAVRDGVIDNNPVTLVRWPKRQRYEARAFTKADAFRLLEIAEQAGEPMRAAITLGLCYGLRRSEVCGLRWTDIDFAKGTLHVQHTVTQNGNLVLDDSHVKTKQSNRILFLVDATIPYLTKLRSEHLKSGKVIDKVVCWPDGSAVRPDGISRMFKTLLRKNGMNTTMRFHDLRHTAASLLAQANVQAKQLQAFMGHDDISVTLGVYTHLSDEDSSKTSAVMSQIINSATNRSENSSESGKIVRIG